MTVSPIAVNSFILYNKEFFYCRRPNGCNWIAWVSSKTRKKWIQWCIYIYYEKSVIYTFSNLIQLYRNINPERCVDLFQMDILGTWMSSLVIILVQYRYIIRINGMLYFTSFFTFITWHKSRFARKNANSSILQHHGSFIISIQEMYYHVQYKLRILTSNNNFFIVTNSGIKIQVTTINYMILIIIKMHYSKYRII